MYCGKCGKDIGSSQFCPWCGNKQLVTDSQVKDESKQFEHVVVDNNPIQEEQATAEPENKSGFTQPASNERNTVSNPVVANDFSTNAKDMTEQPAPAHTMNVWPQPSTNQPPAPNPVVQPMTEPNNGQYANSNFNAPYQQSPLQTNEAVMSQPMPVLDNWKTSIGFSLLGVFIGFPAILILMILLAIPISLGISFLTGATGDFASTIANSLITPVAAFIFYILSIIYAAKFYPSYFTSKPIIKSNRLISFLNLTFGSIIFGALWNSSLSNKNKGGSHTVLVILTSLMLAFMSFQIGSTIFVSVINGASSNAAISYADKTKTGSSGHISFRYPTEWEITTEVEVEGSEDFSFFGQKVQSFSSVGPIEDPNTVLTAYYVPDFEYSFEVFKELMSQDPDVHIDIITIDGYESIKITSPDDNYTSVIIIPNINGKIDSLFVATYPQNDDKCLAVIESIKVVA